MTPKPQKSETPNPQPHIQPETFHPEEDLNSREQAGGDLHTQTLTP